MPQMVTAPPRRSTLERDVLRAIGDGAGFHRARTAIASDAIHTPLLPSALAGARELRLKAECLQPFGSFKLRAAANLLAGLDPAQVADGIACPSAGNFGQGLAIAAARRGIALTVHAPASAAAVKLDRIRELGATVMTHDFDAWWEIMTHRKTALNDGLFLHPVCEAGVIIGNGTIGMELAEQWPEFDTLVVPFGGGGLAAGIALALKSLGHPARIIACEVETSAALSAAFAAGKPVSIERRPSFVDGIGSTRVLDEMWPMLERLIDDVIVVSVEQAEHALRQLATDHSLVVEGAAAVAVAAAAMPACTGKRIVAILSGGNIDSTEFCRILTNREG